ncbi:MAG: chemotaxis protein CheW [Myxococcales bacterium]|nr:chemotaxis protein CheW [Myxococcales bacterium]
MDLQVNNTPTALKTGTTAQFLTFIMNGEEYGLDILRVQEIRGYSTPTPIPHAPPYVRGVINLRGAIVPIVDLRERLGMPSRPIEPTTVVIILKVEAPDKARTVGIVVDAVADVHTISRECLKPTPDFGGESDTNFACAIATIEEKMIIIVDIDRTLSRRALVPATALTE